MNKTDLVNSVATQAELTKADSKKAVDALHETIATTLTNNEKIQLVGFGTFQVRERAARKGRNPQMEKKFISHLLNCQHLSQVKN